MIRCARVEVTLLNVLETEIRRGNDHISRVLSAPWAEETVITVSKLSQALQMSLSPQSYINSSSIIMNHQRHTKSTVYALTKDISMDMLIG